jgi:hypothetical protein
MNHSATDKYDPVFTESRWAGPLGKKAAVETARFRTPGSEQSRLEELEAPFSSRSSAHLVRTRVQMATRQLRAAPKVCRGESQPDQPSTGYPTARLHIVKNDLGTEAGQLRHSLSALDPNAPRQGKF